MSACKRATSSASSASREFLLWIVPSYAEDEGFPRAPEEDENARDRGENVQTVRPLAQSGIVPSERSCLDRKLSRFPRRACVRSRARPYLAHVEFAAPQAFIGYQIGRQQPIVVTMLARLQVLRDLEKPVSEGDEGIDVGARHIGTSPAPIDAVGSRDRHHVSQAARSTGSPARAANSCQSTTPKPLGTKPNVLLEIVAGLVFDMPGDRVRHLHRRTRHDGGRDDILDQAFANPPPQRQDRTARNPTADSRRLAQPCALRVAWSPRNVAVVARRRVGSMFAARSSRAPPTDELCPACATDDSRSEAICRLRALTCGRRYARAASVIEIRLSERGVVFRRALRCASSLHQNFSRETSVFAGALRPAIEPSLKKVPLLPRRPGRDDLSALGRATR